MSEVYIDGCNVAEERKFLIHTDKYSIGEDGLIDGEIPFTDICYDLALQLQRAKEEKQDLINYYHLREGGMLYDIQHWKNKAQELYKKLEQYKKSKQASYESMQAEWNKAVNELRDIKAENKKLKEILSEAEATMLTYKIERDNYKEALIDIRVRFINQVAWVGGISKFDNEIFNKICEVLDNNE